MQICEKVSKKKVTTKHSENCLATQIQNRLKYRDRTDGRPHAYMRKFGVSRITFRESAHLGQLPGVKKASW